MKLLQQNPAPALLTGHSPPAQASQTHNQSTITTSSPRFQGIPDNAISTFISDTGGVLIPSVPMAATRGSTNVFETIYLEIVEDGAYYFALPVVGPLLAKGVAWSISKNNNLSKNPAAQKLTTALDLYKLKLNPSKTYTPAELDIERKILEKKNTHELMGVPIRQLEKELPNGQELLRPILATKAGALIGTFAIAAGLEFMIQHTKNVITAKQFKTKNFAAVAGLEPGKSQIQAGNIDPVEKAKKRGKQVGALVLGSLALAFVAPRAILKNENAFKAAQKFFHAVDFGKGFDLSKPVFAGLITTGVASYMDASRDSLERKEIATRLAVVVPFLLFGKELAGYGIAKALEKIKIPVGNGLKKPIQEILSFTSGKTPWHQMSQAETLLDMNVVNNRAAIDKELKELAEKSATSIKVTPSIAKAITNAHWVLRGGSYVLSALVCGIGINWIAFRQTQQRYKRQQEQRLQEQTLQALQSQRPPALPLVPPNASLAGGRPQLTPSPWRQAQPWPPVNAFAQPFQPTPQFTSQVAQR